jgi:small subunit ribosomal protein S7
MSRKIYIKKRAIKKDYKYNKLLVSMVINNLLKKGKKNIAENILYKAFMLIEFKTKKNPILILEKSIKNISPRVKLESTYLNKSTFQVPKILNVYYSTRIAIKWLIESSKKRSGKTMSIKLSNEVLDSFKGIGSSIKKKEQAHKRAEANKAFIKFNN